MTTTTTSESDPSPVNNPLYPQAPRFASSSNNQTNNNNYAGAANNNTTNAVAPLSSSSLQAVANKGTPATLNLDDIFGDCFFTPDGDTVFLSDQQQQSQQQQQQDGNQNHLNNQYPNMIQSGESQVTHYASKPSTLTHPNQQQHQLQPPMTHSSNVYVPVAQGGGLATTNLDKNPATHRALVMGQAPASSLSSAAPNSNPNNKQQQQQLAKPRQTVPFVQPPQQRHHMQFVAPALPNNTNSNSNSKSSKTTKRSRGSSALAAERKMNDRQKVERRERNREHAKRSRIRKKFLLESLQQSVALLKEENEKLRTSITQELGEQEASQLLTSQNLVHLAANAAGGGKDLIAHNSNEANKVLDDPDFSFIKALQTAQQNFVVTDPSLPDNPIVYATQGFLNLTGYTLDQVLGRNCRFLQGPETDPKATEKIRKSIEEGTDMSVCLLNYRVDGTTFWNQFFIAALRDASGHITNYVGVQCKVSDQYAANVCKRQDMEAATAAGKTEDDMDDDGGDDDDSDGGGD
eukprot:CAMPEP_0198281146 /NCGR_PEP_ID=MMETSP1449-20131203/1124_1 /TAXON_ID=420275 /ORGANISM="Attheya septentrionalis, Strain CCMP2084" /LENGTH=518 /DNA_ID=CAMNT_0043976785 /DNA_START=346 /DNA_END=1902 /DNA_ORIENTATION=+